MHNHIAFTNFVHFNKNEDLFGGPIPAKKCLNFFQLIYQNLPILIGKNL